MIATLTSAAARPCDSAAVRRHDVATGVSPWFAGPICRLSPNGTTGRRASRIHVALSGLNRDLNANHGLTPVATPCRPFGTESQGKPPRFVAELRHCDSPAQWQCDSAAKRRQDVAMGVSPWKAIPILRFSPDGATRTLAPRIPVALSGLNGGMNAHHGLTPVATTCRPVGTESQGASPWFVAIRNCDSAAERRHDVAMGVSPWNAVPKLRLSPDGATRILAPRIPVALSGLNGGMNAHHGLTPVATTCRPVGTESQDASPRLVAELHAQFAESAKLEEAIMANLKGPGYGG